MNLFQKIKMKIFSKNSLEIIKILLRKNNKNQKNSSNNIEFIYMKNKINKQKKLKKNIQNKNR